MNGKKLNSAPPVRGSHRFTPNACPTCRGTDPDSDGPGAKTKPCPDSWHETVTGFFEWTGTTWVRTFHPLPDGSVVDGLRERIESLTAAGYEVCFRKPKAFDGVYVEIADRDTKIVKSNAVSDAPDDALALASAALTPEEEQR